MSTTIARFEREYQSYNGIQSRRAREQMVRLLDFQRFLGELDEPKTLLEAQGAELRAYLADLMDRGLSGPTVLTYRNMIRPFYRWAWQAGLVDGNHLLSIRDVSAPRGAHGGLPRPYKRGEVQQFWKDLDETWPKKSELSIKRWANGTSSWRTVWRHAMNVQIECIVALALYGGLRRVEIFRLELDDFHPENAYIVVRGKANPNTGREKWREVPLTDDMREAITAWLWWRKRLAPDHDRPWLALLGNYRRNPMSFRRFSSLFSGIGGGYELHRFRHTCATGRLRAGMPIEALRDFLGHATISQTLRYAEVLKTDVRRSVESTDVKFMAGVRRHRPAA